MKRARRCLSLLLCLLLATVSFACTDVADTDERPTVMVTVFPAYDFVRALAGDLVRVEMLVSPGNEVHGFEPTFSELSAIRQADLFVYVGGESDAWATELVGEGAASNASLCLMDHVPLLSAAAHEHEHDHLHPTAYDEHIWTSPSRAKLIVAALSEQLQTLLPDHAEAIADREKAYQSELDALWNAFCETVEHAARDTVVFAERFPFRYLCDDLKLTAHSALHGCSGNEEVSLNTMQELITIIKEQELPVVFSIEFSDQRIASILADATGAEPLLLHSCHNVTKEEFETGETYLSLMWDNVEALGKAVGGWHS